MMSTKTIFAAGLFSAFALSACSSVGDIPAPPGQVDKNSPIYDQGFQDGCAAVNVRYRKQSGHDDTARDDKLYASDANYHAGWDFGFRKCEDKVDQGGLPIPGNSVIM
jgi:hypothetical protein